MAMRFVDEFKVFPHATITGRPGPAVDTGVDVHWRGPGRVYLHPQDVAQAVRACHGHEDVSGALEDVGWVPGGRYQAALDEAVFRASEAEERAERAEEQLDQVLATVRLIQADQEAEAEPVQQLAVPVAVPVKRGPGRPRKDAA